jgi:hypothetical protein
MSGLLTRAAYHRNPPREVRDEARTDELAAEAADQARAEVVSVSADGFWQQIEPLLSNLDRLSASGTPCFTPPSIESQTILKNSVWRLWNIEKFSVHGIMYGEALEGRDLDSKEIEFV